MTLELTLESIETYLADTPKIGNGADCSDPVKSKSTDNDNYNYKFAFADIDKFMSSQIIQTQTVQMTTKDNFLSLYNNQYARNVEVFVGILIVSGILAKMMFYPIVRL